MPTNKSLETVTFTAKGRVVIPRHLRRQFEIVEGTKATVTAGADGILIKPDTAALIRKGRGLLKKGTTPLAEEWAARKVTELRFEDV